MAAPAPAPAPLLNLDTIAPPASVVIDGTPYAILAPDALNVLDFRRLQRLIGRLNTLDAQELLTDDEGAELQHLFNAICRIVLLAPAEVHDKLTDLQRIAIYGSFAQLPSNVLQLVGAMMLGGAVIPASSIGANASPVSSGSSAAPRSTGSRGRRSRSSAPTS